MNKIQRIIQLLLENNRYEPGFWPGLHKGKPASKKEANKFILGGILDYQIPASVAWENARRLAEDILGDPDNIWQSIIENSKTKWNAKWKEYSLHRFPKAHERVWRIGEEIVNKYNGDVRNIWKGQSPPIVLDRLNKIKVGEQISRMIVGALCDTEQIQGSGDVKVDIHVRRVLGRILRGEGYTIKEASIVLEKTREMYPENPWMLDKPLYALGTTICPASNPNCNSCYLKKECDY